MMDVHAKERSALSYSLMIMVCVAMLLLFFRDTPPSNKELISMVLGSLLTRLLDVYSFHFQSSYSSHRKDDTISKLAEAAQQSAPVSPRPAVELEPGQSAVVRATDATHSDDTESTKP